MRRLRPPAAAARSGRSCVVLLEAGRSVRLPLAGAPVEPVVLRGVLPPLVHHHPAPAAPAPATAAAAAAANGEGAAGEGAAGVGGGTIVAVADSGGMLPGPEAGARLSPFTAALLHELRVRGPLTTACWPEVDGSYRLTDRPTDQPTDRPTVRRLAALTGWRTHCTATH